MRRNELKRELRSVGTDFGLERIDHQINSTLGKELEVVIAEIRSSGIINKNTLKNSRIAKVVKDHTGLLIAPILIGRDNAWMAPADINRNNVIFASYEKIAGSATDSDKLLTKKDFITGFVNLQTGKVSGDFSEVKCYLGVGEWHLDKSGKYSIRESTAIILHELGHAFVYLEMLGRVTKTAYLLEEGTRRLMGANTKEQKIVILNDIEKYTGTKIDNKEKIASRQNSEDECRVIILSTAIEESKHALNVNIYDSRAWEILADQFSARHGYASDLAIGLDKMNKLYGGQQGYGSVTWSLFVDIFTFLGVLVYGATTIGFGATLVGASIFAVLALLAMGNPLVMEYDPPKERFIKIQQQVNNALKDETLSPEIKAKYIKDHKLINDIISKLNDYPGLYTLIWSTLTPWGRKQSRDIKEVNELESLLNNSLFTAAAILTLR